MPILSSSNRFHTTGFIYQNDRNNLVFYNLHDRKVIDLTSKWQNYTVPPIKTHNGTLRWYATRQNIYYTQYGNGTIEQIDQVGEINHYFYIQDYFMNNETYISKNTTIPITYARAATTGFGHGHAYYNIYPLTVSSGTFEFIFASSPTHNATVNSGIYVWNIFSGKFLARNIGGLGITDRAGNNALTEYSFHGSLASDGDTLTLAVFNFTTDKFNFSYSKFNSTSTLNNLPFFINKLSGKTYLISFYQQRIAGKDKYGSYHAFYSPHILYSTGSHLSKVITVSVNDTINDVETMANQEVLTPYNLSSALQSTPYFHYNMKAYGVYYDYVNNSLLKANISWLNTENNKLGNPHTNILVADNISSIMYTFNATSPTRTTSGTTFTVYWSPLYYKGKI